jgi:hypothetical protein
MKFEIAPKSTEIRANWYDARLYCFALNIDGKTGWRLPNKEELDEIYQSDNDFDDIFYWSSTDTSGSLAWGQHFFNGFQGNFYKNDDNFYVIAIRSIP